MKKSFRAILEYDGTTLRWTGVRVPFDPAETWPNRKGLRVRGTINGFAFRTSLFGSQDKGHLLLVNKQMLKGAKAAVGSLVQVVIEPDLEERSATPPPELAVILKSDRGLKKWFEQLSYSMRKDIAESIAEPKSPEARIRRAELTAEKMMLAMEGERELPPILQIAFRRQPQAALGWKAMTPIQRRSQLLAIFHYQSPESREKRVAKTIAELIRIAERK